MRAKFVKMIWENTAHTIASFYFLPDEIDTPYRYTAGQYALITVPHNGADKRGESRTMTLTSSPKDKLLSISLKIFADGSSYKHALQNLRPNDIVTIYDAMGDLVLPLDPTVPLVFVAGGIGIASYIGMMKSLLENNERRKITLLYGVSKPEDIVLQSVFDSYDDVHGLTKVLYLPQTDGSLTSEKFIGEIVARRIEASDVMRHTSSNSLVYISGPEMMVDLLRKDLADTGFSNQQIIFDYFDGYTSL